MNIKSQISHFSIASKICNLLITGGGEVRFVGGCVRDAILNKKHSDIDIATTLTPEEVEHAFKKHNISYFSIGKAFGTITALFENQQFEITTLRKDLSCDGRYAQVGYTKDWQIDAARRDFTINALSCDLEGNVFDYFNGIQDLLEGKVRFIGNPEQRIIEDHLRILRFFRFSAYYAKVIDKESLQAVHKHVHHLKHVSGTRIRAELNKIFLAPNSLEILRIMNQHGIFEHIIFCDRNSIDNLEKLYKNAADFNFKINEILCLSILLKNSANRDIVINSFAFTRSEYSLLETLLNAKITDWSESGIKNAWIAYKNNFREVVLINLSLPLLTSSPTEAPKSIPLLASSPTEAPKSIPLLASSPTEAPKVLKIGDLANTIEIPGRADFRLARDDESDVYSEIKLDIKSRELLKKLFKTSIQESPVSGKDLKELKIEPGEKMGHLLKIAEKLWYNHEFTISKKEILKELSKYVNEL